MIVMFIIYGGPHNHHAIHIMVHIDQTLVTTIWTIDMNTMGVTRATCEQFCDTSLVWKQHWKNSVTRTTYEHTSLIWKQCGWLTFWMCMGHLGYETFSPTYTPHSYQQVLAGWLSITSAMCTANWWNTCGHHNKKHARHCLRASSRWLCRTLYQRFSLWGSDVVSALACWG